MRKTTKHHQQQTLMLLTAMALLSQGVAVAKKTTPRDTIHLSLDEVLVQVPYGTVRKEALTGSATAIKAKDIEDRPVTNLLQALEGTMAGVYVNSSKSQPGDSPNIVIRGIGTVNGTTAPLYILNGVPYEGDFADINTNDVENITVFKDAAACALYGNRAANGVVLIETKKGKTERPVINFKMRFGSYSQATPKYETLGAKDFMEVSWKVLRNSRMYGSTNEDAATAGQYATKNLISEGLKLNIFNKANDQLFTEDGKMVSDAQILPGYADDLDWWDQLSQKGFRQEYNFGIGQARDKYDYYVSLGHLGQNGYLINNGFNRLTGNVRANIRPVKWFEGGLTFFAVKSHQKTSYNVSGTSSDYVTSNAFYKCQIMSPIYPVHRHNADGSYMLEDGQTVYDTGSYIDANGNLVDTRVKDAGKNVVAESEMNDFGTRSKMLNGQMYVKFKFLKDFSFTARGSISNNTIDNYAYLNPTIGDGIAYKGSYTQRYYSQTTSDFQQQLDWKHNFGLHGVEAMAGHESFQNKYSYDLQMVSNMIEEGVKNVDNFTTTLQKNVYDMKYRTESYFARARYNYAGRYHLMASYRYDGSSRFSSDNRWGGFGSVGASWVVSNEDFMKDVRWVDRLKLRASYGTTGNDAALGYYDGYNLYLSAWTIAGQPTTILMQWAATDLRWEVGKTFGVALETRLFNRWNIAAEYFYRRNSDLLFDVYLPGSAGSTATAAFGSAIRRNIGDIGNKGLELATDVDIIKKKNWNFNFAVTLTHVQNRVETLPEQNKDGIMSDYYRIEEGRSMYSYYLYDFAGVDQLTGRSLYTANLADYCVKDNDGQVVAGNAEGADITKAVTKIGDRYYVNNTTYAQKEFCGSALPTVYGSFRPTLRWKGLTVSALFSFELGGKVFDNVYREMMSTEDGNPHSYHQDILKSWTAAPEGMTEESADRLLADGVPEINPTTSTYDNAVSSRFLVSGDYLTFKNLTVGYSLPAATLERMHIQGLSFSFTAENLFTVSARKGMDPQQTVNGINRYRLASARTFTLGMDLKF